jgi:hypothetical protein
MVVIDDRATMTLKTVYSYILCTIELSPVVSITTNTGGKCQSEGNRRGCPEIIDKFPRSRNNTVEESIKIYTHHKEMDKQRFKKHTY